MLRRRQGLALGGDNQQCQVNEALHNWQLQHQASDHHQIAPESNEQNLISFNFYCGRQSSYLLMEIRGGMQHQKQHSGGTLGVRTPVCACEP